MAKSDDHLDPDLVAVTEGPAAAAALTRTALDRERILRAAIAFIDEHGLAALTMRRLGAQLGVEAMALYRYVPGREDLLDGVVETVVDSLFDDDDVPDEIHLEHHSGWPDYLMRLAHGVRRIALAHPAVFPLIASRPPAAPWVRPPLRSLRMVESFLSTMREGGFPPAAAVAAYRAYSSFLLGHLLLEVSQRGAPVSMLDQPDGDPDAQARTDLRPYPHLTELEPLLGQDKSAAEFEESLENLLDRLTRVLHEARNSDDGSVLDL